MPAISIRTSSEFHNTNTGSGNGIACKFVVNQLLSLDPELYLAEVLEDTDNQYFVYLRIQNSNVGFCIYNSGRSLHIESTYWDGQDSPHGINGYTLSDYFGYYYSYNPSTPDWFPYIKVSVVGVDGALKYIVFSSSRLQSVAYMYYGMFTSTAHAEPTYCVGCSTNPLVAIYPSLPVIPFGSTMPTAIGDPTGGTYENATFTSFEAKDFVKEGYTHALLPAMYYAYTQMRAFLNIKWGGKYDIYRLYNTNGIVQTAAGETVTINGIEMLSPGYVTVIE